MQDWVPDVDLLHECAHKANGRASCHVRLVLFFRAPGFALTYKDARSWSIITVDTLGDCGDIPGLLRSRPSRNAGRDWLKPRRLMNDVFWMTIIGNPIDGSRPVEERGGCCALGEGELSRDWPCTTAVIRSSCSHIFDSSSLWLGYNQKRGPSSNSR